MISQVKRLCCSSSNVNRQWHPVVDDSYLRLPTLEPMIVARVRDRRLTSSLLPLVNSVYPWPTSLKHVKRLYQENDHLDILLYPPDYSSPFDKIQFEKYFEDETKILNIPQTPCLLRWQHEQCQKAHWPNLTFRENKDLEASQLNKDLTPHDEIILDLLKKIQNHDSISHCAIVVSDDGHTPLVGSRDYRDEHPLQHATMVAIDLLAVDSVYSRSNLLDQFIEKKKEKSAYLLNGCSIYLTHEPCVMCAMALLHSRISTVYYLQRNENLGALGSRYKLNALKKTNHRFSVYQLVEHEEN